jgi:cytochrome c peroxidase
MKLSLFRIPVLGSFLLVAACNGGQEKQESVQSQPDFRAAQNYYLENINKAIIYMDSLSIVAVEDPRAKLLFEKAREAFKRAEPIGSYLNPAVGHRVNGPALPVYKEDSGKILLPIGFQKIEESLYEGGVSQTIFQREVAIAEGLLQILADYIVTKDIDPQRFFIATHQQLLRIISLGISGFDTPVSHLGLSETIISLESLNDVYDLTIREIILGEDPSLDHSFKEQLKQAVAYIKVNMDFDTFDRFSFIRNHMNPITRSWVALRKASGLWEGVDTYPFNFEAPTFFEENSFNVGYFTPAVNLNPSEAMIKLGEKLFFDQNLSRNGSMACATCHIPEKAYADGLVTNFDNEGSPLQRNTPTLINAVFQQAFFWDGRSTTVMDQISSVFANEQEFDRNVHQFSDNILKDSTYQELFTQAYGRIPTHNREIIRAISSYISTLNAFNSKFDRNIRGEEATFTSQEIEGFNLYMGKALCATCHFIPLTNGSVPPFYQETEREVIGVPETTENKQLDDDTGFYWKFEEALHKGMFKTPTVRNAALTAPYMHNGVYSTMEEVINFYNLGGGGGLGFDLAHQTLPFDELNLSAQEQQALVAFMQTLSDTEISAY